MNAARTLPEIKAELRALLPELRRRYPISYLGVFGSWARGEERPGSDLDLLIDFDGPIGWEIVDLRDEIAARLGCRSISSCAAVCAGASGPGYWAKLSPYEGSRARRQWVSLKFWPETAKGDDAVYGLAFARHTAAPGGVFKPDAIPGRAGTPHTPYATGSAETQRPWPP